MKIFKAGTTVLLHYSCNFAGCKGYTEYVLESDYTESDLNDLAYEQAVEHVAVEGWFEVKK